MAMTLDELQSQLGGLKEYQPADEAALRQRAENVYKPQYEQDQLSLKDQLYTALATQGRSALANGMQRSSYNQAAKASIQGQGLRAQSQLAANYEGNVAQLLNNLIEGDKDRATAAGQQRDNLLLQLYQLGQAGSGGGSGSGYEYSPQNNPYGDPDDAINGLKDDKWVILPGNQAYNNGRYYDYKVNGVTNPLIPQNVLDSATKGNYVRSTVPASGGLYTQRKKTTVPKTTK